MGIEANPQNVDALNPAWPAVGEPAEEGYLHIQNVKRAVKARANTGGQYGVTKLSSALDSTDEESAATPAAVKQVNDKTDANTAALTELEEDFGENLANAISGLQFGNNKDANKGHQRFPGGFKINWVKVTGAGTKNVVWDDPFTLLACFVVLGTSAPGYYNTRQTGLTLTGCTVVVDGGGGDGTHYVVAGGFDNVTA